MLFPVNQFKSGNPFEMFGVNDNRVLGERFCQLSKGWTDGCQNNPVAFVKHLYFVRPFEPLGGNANRSAAAIGKMLPKQLTYLRNSRKYC